MTTYQNPLIQDNTVDTLANTEKVAAFLQNYYMCSTQPKIAECKDAHEGLFWICRFLRQALEYELERLEKVN